MKKTKHYTKKKAKIQKKTKEVHGCGLSQGYESEL
jgi:hypothetical protein